MERSDTSLYSDCWHSLRGLLLSFMDDENASLRDYSYACEFLSLMDDIEKDIFPY